MANAKPKLYIIHGWTYTVAPWERTISLLEKQGLSVEMLHVPGLTASSKKVWTIEEYVRWADRNIPDGAVALGHSNGGRILLNLCSEKPEKLQHLILLDSAGVYEASNKRDLARGLSKRLSFLKKVPGLAKVWHKLTGASDYARAPENMKKTLSNMLDSDKDLDFSKVTVPTSIIWGAADTVTPPHQAEIMHQKIKNSQLEIFPNWTHAPYISHPAELAKVIFRTFKRPPEIIAPVEVTEASTISASLALKKAAEPEIPSTVPISATLAFKKAAGPSAHDTVSRSAALAVPSGKPRVAPPSRKVVENVGSSNTASSSNILDELKEVDYEKADLTIPVIEPRRTISTSSVPKVGRLERMRRKLTSPKPSQKQSEQGRKISSRKPRTRVKSPETRSKS